MQYHSQQFTQIAEAAAAHIRPLILQTIHELATDFRAKFPECTRIDFTKGFEKYFHNLKEQYENINGHPLCLFIYDTMKEQSGIRANLVLQPEILVDGVPIAEAIEAAQVKTYVVLRSTGTGYDYARETLYCGPDYHTAKHIVLTDHRTGGRGAGTDADQDPRQDLEHWCGGRCLEVEEYAPEDFTH